MINHYIIMASAYSIGKRIVLDYCYENDLNMHTIQNDINYITKKCGEDISISSHSIQTKSSSWESVIRTDKFFKDTLVVKTKEEFVKIVLKDRELVGTDIAKYILSVIPCTHLKLEKLAYMCYADYMCSEGEKLFTDKIYSYKLGPVIESIYNKYTKSGKGLLEVEDDKITYDEDEKKLPSRSRILASKDGLKKLLSIDKTLKMYGNYTASQLVDITHRKDTPWNKSGAGTESYIEISDELIKKYHKNENV